MDIKILSPGEKLKSLRKQYKIKQYELCGTYITRNMISMIETNKATLNPATAQVLLQNMKELCTSKELPFNVTLEYLLESPATQAQAIAVAFISNLTTHPELIKTSLQNNDFIQMSALLEQYNLAEERATLFELIGTFFQSQNLYKEALPYFLVSFECVAHKDINRKYTEIAYHLMNCNYHLNYFTDILYYSHLFFHYQPHCFSSYASEIYIYTILSYYQLEKYPESLNLINKYQQHFDLNIELEFIKADCLRMLNKPKEAIPLYHALLKRYDLALEEEIRINLHLISTYLEYLEYLAANALLEKVLVLVHTYEKVSYGEDLINIYNHLASIYITKHDFNTAISYHCLTLKQVLRKSDSSILDTILIQILTYISSCSTVSQIDFIKIYGKLLCTSLITNDSYTLTILVLSYHLNTPNLMYHLLSCIEQNNTLHIKKIPEH